LSATYRLDYLGPDGAAAAIQKPAREAGVKFGRGAAAELLSRLAMKPRGAAASDPDPDHPVLVQPFHLQVVCNALWRGARAEYVRDEDFQAIKVKDVKKHADIDGALRGYYAGIVKWVAGEAGVDEKVIRRWISNELITDDEKFRRQTLAPPADDDRGRKVLRELERLYLIWSDTRGDSTWYELSHDQLIQPIIRDNQDWELPRLSSWQVAARNWKVNRDPRHLLTGLSLRGARREADSTNFDLDNLDREFLAESERKDSARVIQGLTNLRSRMVAVAVFEFVVILVLATLLFAR
jgi:hypothetical protein